MASKTKSVIFTVLRTALSLGLAALLIRVTLTSSGTTARQVVSDLLAARFHLLILAVAIFGGIQGICIRRWQLLLRIQGVHLSYLQTARLGLIGVFFNLAIPGAVSGDLIKMGYIARHAPDRKAEAIMMIMLDRVLGLLGLFAVASVAVLCNLRMLLDLPPEFRMIQMGAFLVGLGSLGGLVAVLLVEIRQKLVAIGPIARLITLGSYYLPHVVVGILQRFTNALELCRNSRRTVIVAFALSIGVHTCTGINLFCIGRALGETNLAPKTYFLSAQVANAVGAIPVTPAGVGTRDATVAAFFKAFNATAGKAGVVPLTLSLTLLLYGLIGALVFVFSPGARTDAVAAEEQE